ncbi:MULTISPECIES: ABC transporter substrate-binding protein [unclassified Microbacterium]|uniref:ABC transporter substrate-binding protein n=1 Tax=unclassified Microbacterium TaxID=2609290 RepID=UPI00178154EF|nr:MULTISPECIES: ABC transporter substrate-binding protein [unclassified Microbacterium]MBD8207392.1 ABC transporter substrate-binding protein [Microbacterium sp. CFBP 8801]MBD8217221.1 ABC transporter substrate-binding protein [Microbacterium sp. CFBP 13617]MBD8477250.1 ABC transporter substrate-binding protein [Microbacterium sp. CFBP 8794]MBD8508913.1 ABC transporter substrate-binding protein [Microbacterium sp. CFBP 8790]
MSISKRMRGVVGLFGAGAVVLSLAGCAGGADAGSDASSEGDVTTVGFVAVGPEGGWRNANEQAVKDAFSADAGFDLKYAPAASPSDQKSQLDAFTTFVNDEVDVILLTATEASGWDSALELAKEAEIPVVLLDRGVDASDDLYVTRIAPDNKQVAASVGSWAVSAFPTGANYFVLEGVPGLSVVNERNEGFDSEVSSATGFTKVGAQTANWKTDEGKSVVETVLKANNNDIQFIFAQNDEMGIGAAQAVSAAGLTPGTDVKIATIDGTKGALEALSAGQLSFVAQYNPFFGDTAVDAAKKALAGETVEKTIIVKSATFDSPAAADTALSEGLGF